MIIVVLVEIKTQRQQRSLRAVLHSYGIRRLSQRFLKNPGETENIGVLKIRNRIHHWSSGTFILFY